MKKDGWVYAKYLGYCEFWLRVIEQNTIDWIEGMDLKK